MDRPTIHEPALMQKAQEQYANHNEFLQIINKLYKDLEKYYSFLEHIEYRTKEIWEWIKEELEYKYSKDKYSRIGFAYLFEINRDAYNMLEGINFLKNALNEFGQMFFEGINPQDYNDQPFVYVPVFKRFIMNTFREFPDPRFEKLKW